MDQINSEFESLHSEIVALIESVYPRDSRGGTDRQNERDEGLRTNEHWETHGDWGARLCSALIARAGATIEQTFNAINSNFWDRPVEWTGEE
ncbi:MAG TPA: hypothetical protein VEZ90_16005, partial [Blastocatellia bacterium]|nr:hypothetical protein [Blastocatellia bacterium]